MYLYEIAFAKYLYSSTLSLKFWPFALAELDAAARERAHLASKSELFAAATDPGIQKTPTSHRKRYLGSSRKQGQPIYVDPVDMMIRQTCRVKHLGKVQMRHECERTTLSTQFANAFPSLTEVIEALKELITHELRTINRVRLAA